MTHCTQCGAELALNDQFCGKCGHRRGGAVRDGRRGAGPDRSPRREATPTPALDAAACRTAFNAILARKAARTHSARIVLACLALAMGLAALGGLAWNVSSVIWLGVPAVICAVLVMVADFSRWSEAEYYSVPGSRDDRGEHRCIHCGNRGIYRHGQYKSHTKYADCSKCKVNLWAE